MTAHSRSRGIKQGDIMLITLDPTVGTEIQGKRPVLVISNSEFNRGGRVLVAAITQGGNLDRVRGWTVTLTGSGTETQGAVVLSQCRMLDIVARGGKYIETVPEYVFDEAMAKFQAALDPE